MSKVVGPLLRQGLRGRLAGGDVPLRAVGALTSKPYAFTSRSWELKSVESVDVLDGIGSNIRIDTRGQEIMRVLPRLNEDVNEEWISDKTRFSYDGLKRQRLNTPMVRDTSGELVRLGWDKVPDLIRHRVLSFERKYQDTGYEVQAIIGPYVDEEAALSLRNLMHRWFPNSHIHVQEQPTGVSSDFRENYIFNSTLVGIESSDLCLLIGSNPRKEAPLLNTRIRKAVIHNHMTLASVGCAVKLTYPYHHLGTSVKTLEELASGKHPFCEALKSAERPSLIISNKALQRVDGGIVFNLARKIADECGLIKENWDGFNVLHTGANAVGAMDLGFDDKYRGLRTVDSDTDPWSKTRILYLLGADELDNVTVPDDCFVIYQGHHGDRGASMADLILPGAAYTEKTAIYVNTEGRVQKSKLSFFPPGAAKNDATTIDMLMASAEGGLPPTRGTLQILAPNLLRTGTIQKADRLFGSGLAVDPTAKSSAVASDIPLAPPVDNFYMTDPITRSSKVMAKCSRVIRESNFDF